MVGWPWNPWSFPRRDSGCTLCFGGPVPLYGKEYDNQRHSEHLPQFLPKENWKWPLCSKGRTCLLPSRARGGTFFSTQILLFCCLNILRWSSCKDIKGWSLEWKHFKAQPDLVWTPLVVEGKLQVSTTITACNTFPRNNNFQKFSAALGYSSTIKCYFQIFLKGGAAQLYFNNFWNSSQDLQNHYLQSLFGHLF